ncbi:MAG: 23S rRNA (pseudouridine(1915)-N(3))-methyltransferase RlmH, partial [Gammaproteobacteria bacterium]|nr:23S rRNA (pseudouridine(1915)-N(3))-methyltransferase RlmH [Gammaproteobacteria bacterium]
MLKIELVAVGTKPPAWVLDGIQQYTSRLTRECRFSITEIRTSDRKKPKSVNSLKNEEGKALLAAVSDSARVIVLDRSGKDWST